MTARRACSPGKENICVRCSRLVRRVSLTEQFPESCVLYPYRSGVSPSWRSFRRFSRDRGSPFAVAAVSGRYLGRLFSPDMESIKPVGSNLRLHLVFAFSNPVSHFRQFAPVISGPLAVPVASYSAGVKGPPRLRPSAGRCQRATRFAGYGRLKPIGLTSGYGCLSRCRIQVLVPKWLSTVCSGLWPGRLRVPWRSEKSFRLAGCDLRRVSHVGGATRFAGYGRWHSSRHSLLLGFDLKFEVAVDSRNNRFTTIVKRNQPKNDTGSSPAKTRRFSGRPGRVRH